MKLFIASHSQVEAAKIAEALVSGGHQVTARWITEDKKFHQGSNAYTNDELTAIAVMDEEDVRRAVDGVVLIAEAEGKTVPGGKHVETGMALALGRAVFVIGRRENIFHWHPRVKVFPDVTSLTSFLASPVV